jgi:hypothetical protein
MATAESIEPPTVATLTRAEIEFLGDKAFGLGISNIAALSRRDQANLVIASRVIRRLLAAYERGTGRQLSCIMLAGGC